MSSPSAPSSSTPPSPSTSTTSWSVDSWRSFPIQQQPSYSDSAALDTQLKILRTLPPLVHPNEVDALRAQLAQVAQGKRFLLQGGDCAERFQDCAKKPIEAKLKILLQMSLVLTWGARIPTVRVGRIAGQYGKPRSSPIEKLEDGSVIPSFKGDNINCYTPNNEARQHDPSRLVLGHFHSAATINYIRALIKGGYADLHHSRAWDLGGVRDVGKRSKYQEISRNITDSLDFMEVCGVTEKSQGVSEVDFFTSHEGLVMEYESAVTQLNQENNKHYNLGAHFLWIGNRTRDVNCAHIEYFRGIANPIGIKVDSEIKPHELIALLDRLDPNKEPGRITLISRFGAEKIFSHLPPLIKAIQEAGRQFTTVWSCDPMHGNTYSTSTGIKTRDFDAILAELTNTFTVHQENGSFLGGVHFELTGEHVTECVGGPQDLDENHLTHNYTTYCDPRLNYLQSMEMSFLLADLIKSRHGKKVVEEVTLSPQKAPNPSS